MYDVPSGAAGPEYLPPPHHRPGPPNSSIIGASKSCARRIEPMKKVAKTLLGHSEGSKSNSPNSVIEG
jgi:hypothetical protein